MQLVEQQIERKMAMQCFVLSLELCYNRANLFLLLRLFVNRPPGKIRRLVPRSSGASRVDQAQSLREPSRAAECLGSR